MLTSKDIEKSEKLTEEYGSGRDHEPGFPEAEKVFEVGGFVKVRMRTESAGVALGIFHTLIDNVFNYSVWYEGIAAIEVKPEDDDA